MVFEDDNISFSTRFMLFENDGLSLMRFLSVNPFCEIIPIFIYVFKNILKKKGFIKF